MNVVSLAISSSIERLSCLVDKAGTANSGQRHGPCAKSGQDSIVCVASIK